MFIKPQLSPVSKPSRLPPTIRTLYHPSYQSMSEEDLKAECYKVFQGMKISEEESDFLAKSTQLQSKSLLWFEHRCGHLTASRFRSLCHTNLEKPSQSLISAVFQHNSYQKSPALTWGLEKEDIARGEYREICSQKHISFQIKPTGLHINHDYPHLGASPDGLVSCTCCGDGLLEIKCPYSLRFSHINSAGDDFYLKHTSNGLKLSTSHAYYYQIQGQLSICDRLYCDFVCWTPKGIHIERIFRQHLFSQMKPKLDAFFVHVVLPCVLRGEMDKENARPSSQEYCYCRKGEKGKMVACDNKSCAYEWFHFSCVGLESEPQGAWFCPGCQMQRH